MKLSNLVGLLHVRAEHQRCERLYTFFGVGGKERGRSSHLKSQRYKFFFSSLVARGDP